MLKLLLKHCAREADVTPRMVADKDALEWLARNQLGEPEHPVIQGWRREVFGQHALKMLQGTLALRLHPQTGDVVFEG